MRIKLFLLFLLVGHYVNFAQETYVPDSSFENYLETHDANGNTVAVGDVTSMGNGIANDNKVFTSRIDIVENLNISRLNIANVSGIEDFVSLKTFNCSNNGIVNLDVSENLLLTSLSCSRNLITNLDITNNTQLTILNCAGNQISSINLLNNTKLESLSCYENSLTSIDVAPLLHLNSLDCVDNNITSLDVSNNIELEYLQVYENLLTSLDLSKNVKLIELYAEYNQITSLDVSKNTSLVDLSIYSNQLTYLNVRNGNNGILDHRDFDIRNNPGLTCVSVDDPAYATATFTKKDGQTNFVTFCSTTNIPDDNFEAYLETHNATGGLVSVGDPTSMGNGIANDNLVGTEAIENITYLNISNQGITDFTGIEGFVALKQFRAFQNSVTSLDLSTNTNLTEIACSDMGLTNINLSGLMSLEKVELRNNNLNTIDLSSNSQLKYLYLDYNSFNTIDVNSNTELLDLRLRENSLTELDITNNTNLTRLYCSGNSLTSINVLNNTLLETLSCGENQLTNLDVSSLINLTDLFLENITTLTALDVSQNTNLEDIGCNGTPINTLDLSSNTKLIEVYTNGSQITELDLSNSPNVEYIECQNGQLRALYLKNGNNSSNIELYATGNPNLTCITVDDPTASYLANWEKDATATFSEYCRLTYVPDDVFENFLENNGYGNGIANDDYVYTALVEVSEGIVFQNNEVEDLTGIEDFTEMWYLICRNTNLSQIDLSNNKKLTTLSLANNKLTNIDLSSNTLLEQVLINDNSLGTVDLSSLFNLRTLNLDNTGLAEIDVKNNSSLVTLRVGENELTQLDVSTNSNLTHIYLANNNLELLNVANGNNHAVNLFDSRGNTNLNCIQVDNVNGDFSLWEKEASSSYALYCELTYVSDANFENYLETHDTNGNIVSIGDANSLGNGIANDNQVATSKVKNVVNLNISSQNIADLTGIEAFLSLESLNCSYNQLTSLDLSANSNLRVLDAAENDLTSLDFSGYNSLEEVELRSNSITSLIIGMNSPLRKLRVGKNRLTTLDVSSCSQLEDLYVHQNLLVSLDVRNGNNGSMLDFFAKYNPSLTCIEVDNASASYLTTWQRDDIANFSENCNTVVWSGSSNSNWEENNNWVGNVKPISTNNVAIPSFTTTPNIVSRVLAEVNDLSIEEFASFNINDNGAIIVNGNLKTNNNVSITSSENTSGILIVKGTANGLITYERSGLEANKWSLVAVPVSGQSIKEFIENPTNDIRVNTSVTPNRYAIAYYDDNLSEGNKWRYITSDDIQTNTLAFEKGKGYIISRANDGAITFTGNVETSNITIGVQENKWNALGNPFTAYLPINNNSNENFIQSNLGNFNPENVGVYSWNNVQNKYVAKTLLSPITSLTVGQGFFVKSNAIGSSFSFNKDHRLSDNSNVEVFSREINNTIPSIQLLVTQNGVTVETDIKYLASATKGLDPGYDVGNFGGASFDVFTHLLEESTGKDFTLQSLPNFEYESMVIPVGLKSDEGLDVVFSTKTKNLPEGLYVYLEDTKENTYTELKDGSEYRIHLTEKEDGIGRFYLHTKSETLSTEENNLHDIRIYMDWKDLLIKGNLIGKVNIAICNTEGKKVYEVEKKELKDKYDLSGLSRGVYIVRLKTEKGVTTKKILLK
ncbi:T9SS type A sorting domain-containing protein [Tenacibaculum xiamenense]|uniref:T9SS type A sorting domain-containing protein n=1 Tax=Tenacibaculum xiamenense TaxID=1261553 RepID=UPI003895D957